MALQEVVKGKKNVGGNKAVAEKGKPANEKDNANTTTSNAVNQKREKRKRKRMESKVSKENEGNADKSNAQSGPSPNKKQKPKQVNNSETNANKSEDVNAKKRPHEGATADEPNSKLSKEENDLLWSKALEWTLSEGDLTEPEQELADVYKTFPTDLLKKKGFKKWKAMHSSELTNYTPVSIVKVFNLIKMKFRQMQRITSPDSNQVNSAVKEKKKLKKMLKDKSATQQKVDGGNADVKANGLAQKKQNNKKTAQVNSPAQKNAQQKVNSGSDANNLKQNQKNKKNKQQNLTTGNAQQKTNGVNKQEKTQKNVKGK